MECEIVDWSVSSEYTRKDDHKWTLRSSLFFCSRCGVVKRANGENKACKGKIEVTLR